MVTMVFPIPSDGERGKEEPAAEKAMSLRLGRFREVGGGAKQ
jgi:hypothetical protein